MATKTEEKIAQLDLQLIQLRTEHAERSNQTKVTMEVFRNDVKDLVQKIQLLESELASLKQKTLELDKRADRSWSLAQALIVVTITLLVSALTQLLLKR